jgi:hypothetical protein
MEERGRNELISEGVKPTMFLQMKTSEILGSTHVPPITKQ